VKNEIIIGLGGLLLCALTYFAGVWRTEKRYLQEEKSDRMDAVFNRYMEFRKTNRTGGYDGLLKAGIATLESDAEIRELTKKIVAHAEMHPLGGEAGPLNEVDLKIFFDYASREGVNFHRTSLEEVIEKSRA